MMWAQQVASEAGEEVGRRKLEGIDAWKGVVADHER